LTKVLKNGGGMDQSEKIPVLEDLPGFIPRFAKNAKHGAPGEATDSAA
jgi:hypothetical protein